MAPLGCCQGECQNIPNIPRDIPKGPPLGRYFLAMVGKKLWGNYLDTAHKAWYNEGCLGREQSSLDEDVESDELEPTQAVGFFSQGFDKTLSLSIIRVPDVERAP